MTHSHAAGGGRPAAFLDRDGVINVDRGFTHEPADLAFTPTAINAIRMLNMAGYLVIVVTNQSGVARGIFSTSAVEFFHAHMQAELAAFGTRIDAFYYCPYHPLGSVPAFAMDDEDRKPRPGMLLRARREWPIIWDRSFMIGDRPTDLLAAERAGLTGLLIEKDEGDLAAAVSQMLAATAHVTDRSAGAVGIATSSQNEVRHA